MRSPYSMPVSLAVMHIWRRTLTWSSPVHIQSKETVAPGQCFAMSNHARDTCSSRLKSSREESVTFHFVWTKSTTINNQVIFPCRASRSWSADFASANQTLAPASLEVRCATPVPNRSILSVNVAAKVCQPQVVSYWANNSFFFYYKSFRIGTVLFKVNLSFTWSENVYF